MTGSIHLGYVVGTGEPVEIPLRHTAVTGQTQESGKTTTLEGLIHRSGLQAIAYVTKRGESSFHVMKPIAPYFQERADWKFVQSLLEASTESKLKFEQSWIMRASEGARTLQDVRTNIQKYLNGVRDTRPVKQRRGAEVKDRWIQKPARGMNADIYYVLNKYLDDIMPALASLPYSTELKLADGLNVMDLREYEFPLQCLVMRSVTDRIRQHEEGTVNIIPEAWKFAPKFRGTPVRLAAEEYIREAAAMKNFLWIDSQDLAGVADVLMRQVGVWLFGVQRATREIHRALDHMPEGLPAKRPRPADIATLSKGQFYVCFGREMHKVYVQPAWMEAAHAEAIARGEEEIDSAGDILREYANDHRDRRTTAEIVRTESKGRTNSDASGLRDVSSELRHKNQDTGRNDGNHSQTYEEAMWKEKYEDLKLTNTSLETKCSLLEQRILELEDEIGVKRALAAVPDFGKPGGHIEVRPFVDIDALLMEFTTRARKDPAIIQLLREIPEMRVKTTRPILSIDGSTMQGRLCQLITEGFFKKPQSAKLATAEAVRRGWCHPKTPMMRVQDPLDKIAGMGFLTREADGYLVVPGMKINIVEA
jgi:hypothetical protein